VVERALTVVAGVMWYSMVKMVEGVKKLDEQV
jgi:hypothetical protein